MKNQKGFIVPVLLAIIAVLVVGGGVYVYNDKKDTKVEESTAVETETQQSEQAQEQTTTQTPPTSSQANWKTYNSTQYGFLIQHPSETKISDTGTSGGRSFYFTTASQGTVIVQVVTQAWNNGVLSSPANCNDTASGADRTNTNINGVNFLTFSMSKEMSGMNSPASATEYCAIRNGIAYKLITKVGYAPGSSNGLNLDKNPTLNQMVASFKLN